MEERNTRSFYPRVQKRVRVWGLLTDVVIFALVLPFLSYPEAQLVEDAAGYLRHPDGVRLFYYLTHRFLFHDGPWAGPLIWVHAVHHQQRNPCRADSSYLHPLEPVLGWLFTPPPLPCWLRSWADSMLRPS
ncbi:MAG: sterol desaturase family protein [Gammaproteobacteria bacterium]|nr:sterol desaturase family protein [Gammaproteobacteria bacterium]